jgi:hypothetical protein
MIASPGYHSYGVSEASSLSFSFFLAKLSSRWLKQIQNSYKYICIFWVFSRQISTVFLWEKYGQICRLSSSK